MKIQPVALDNPEIPIPELPLPVPVAKVHSQVRVADQLASALEAAGIRVVFGVPGGSIAALYDALMDQPRIRVVNMNQESTAVHAAAAYARATGSVGVVLTTSGPGVTNAVTGIASAFCDGAPLLVIGGEVPRANFGRGALQEGSPYHLNLVGMLRGITKSSTEVIRPDAAVSALRKALATASSGRKGPVFLSLPLDIQAATASVPRMTIDVESSFQLDRATLDAAVHQLITAERPLILAGSGARWAGGPRALRELAERLQIPVATTPKAKGVFPESHPLSLGVFGYGGHPSASEYLRKRVDVLFAVGTSFGDVATNGWADSLRPEKCLIQVDIDSAQIGRNYSVDLGITGPAERVLLELAQMVPPKAPFPLTLGRQTHTDASACSGGQSLKPQRVLWELQQILPRSTAYTCDIGEHLMFALHYLTIDQPDGFHVSTGLSAMGSSLGAAMGVKLAHPDRPVVAVCGDGSLSMAAMDIAAAAQAHLDVIYLVMADGRYGMVEDGNLAIYGRTPLYPITLDIQALAKGVGARAYRIERPGELLELGAKALLDGPGPVVIEARIDPKEKMPRRARFETLRHFVANDAARARPN
ncbi:MAG: thiamine pyrophosphate-binding protein [Myxococcaceae bacterium]